MWRRPACQTLLKALDISSAATWVALDLLKVLAILSDLSVRISALEQESLKPYWGNQKKGHISLGDQQSSYF